MRIANRKLNKMSKLLKAIVNDLTTESTSLIANIVISVIYITV